MGLFSTKEKLNLLQKTQYNLEQTQKNLENYVIKSSNENSIIEKPCEKISPKQAAYALNLCTVSITQIIDYMDLNIMEQEYDMILNNLNLQNMPDDDSFLSILKQILTTITFFKIEQKEREFVERDYKQRMKNAVWSAIPSMGALVMTGLSQGPAKMALSLSASVGTAYMSYRKEKSENELQYEKELWQLERSALEQFEGLKRELFDTAWRVSKHYGFEDEFRLSERQIHQYNSILMDKDVCRRYDRMDAIKDYFKAYPPFWYQFGHTANLVSLNAYSKREKIEFQIDNIEKEVIGSSENKDHLYEELLLLNQEVEDLIRIENDYKEYARSHFEEFQKENEYGLLREDKIAAMNDLEYVELLIQMGNYNESDLLFRLKIAAQKAGNALEVLQLCVFSYMKLGKMDLVENYLKILVNEDYNKVMNAQLLSSLYVYKFYNNIDRAKTRWKYSVLSDRVDKSYLFPMPQSIDANKEILDKQFICIQKIHLLKKYKSILNELTNRYSIKFNKCIPMYKGMHVNEERFIDKKEYRLEMKQQISLRMKRDKENWFKNELKSNDLFAAYATIVQEYFNTICALIKDIPSYSLDFQFLKEDLLSPISDNALKIENFRNLLQEDNKEGNDELILDYLFSTFTFMFFTQEMLRNFVGVVTEKVQKMNEMNEVAKDETLLFQFCNENRLNVPDEIFVEVENELRKADSDFLIEQVLGDDRYQEQKKRNELRKELKNLVLDFYDKNEKNLLKRSDKSHIWVCGKHDDALNEYFKKIKCNTCDKSDVLLVIEEEGANEWFNHTDLWITIDELMIIKSDKNNSKCTYAAVDYDGKDKLICGKKKYANSDDVNMGCLWDLICEIKKIATDIITEKDISGSSANNCFEVIEEDDSPKLSIVD